MICVICKNKKTPAPGGWDGGHNPWPIKKKGKCCGKCNDEKVTPKRLEQYMRRSNERTL